MNYAVGASLLDRLRAETRAQHESIEQRLDILDPSLSLSRYRQILRDFHGFYAPVERRIGPYGGSPAWKIDSADRRKLDLIKKDLNETASQDPSDEPPPECGDLPPLDSIPEQLGCMYVLEGSTLGGQHVLRHVAKRLDLSPQKGASFFNSYGRAVGINWRSFLSQLDERTHSREHDEVVSSARQTFAKLEAWITRRDRAL
jgi:heme oxygenase